MERGPGKEVDADRGHRGAVLGIPFVALEWSGNNHHIGVPDRHLQGQNAGGSDAFVAEVGEPPSPTPVPATATPTSIPTPLPTATSVPLTVRVRLAHRSVKAGQQQTITVTTQAGALVDIAVTFPSGRKLRHSATAGPAGTLRWRFKEPGGIAKGRNHTVNVQVTVSDSSGQTASARTHFSG